MFAPWESTVDEHDGGIRGSRMPFEGADAPARIFNTNLTRRRGVVLKTLQKLAASLAMMALGSSAFLALAQEKKVKDQAEYDIFMAASKETDPAKKIQLLQQWKEKYPGSDYKEDRLVMIIDTYQRLRQADNMWNTSVELLQMNPSSVPALFFLTSLTTSTGNTTAERLDTGEKAARGLLGKLDEIIAKSNAAEDQKKRERLGMETMARRTIGWIAMTKKDFEKCEQEFTDLVKVHPNSGQVAYWLGSCIVAQKKPEKQISALWQFARAANYRGEDELPEASRTQLAGFLERNYVSFHGGKDGLPEMIARAMKEPLRPADFDIESASARAAREYNELLQSNPQKALWLNVRKELVGASGNDYFESSLKGSALPKLKGKIVAMKPEARPKEIDIYIASENVAEIRLVLDAPFPNKAEIGTEIEFDGAVAKAFTSDPFLLTCDIEKAKITGWPAPPARVAPPVRKAIPGKKK